ncbi:hypothetical protein BDB00DRAFT_784499 [Zychaea mexicana]|uniref:uncharacterized protein n=1 Tax=Zychaea mexicana TaxID=64656 RepID=UPI0022FEA773|nr:uncharacterized protein BDB00DRAFT_784499 [Zychaea mexicana]KAI9497559.1 hypothetical protein BDB00DRAFT_784499 [Zychaea mexicana]
MTLTFINKSAYKRGSIVFDQERCSQAALTKEDSLLMTKSLPLMQYKDQNLKTQLKNEEAYDDQHFDYEDFTDSIDEIPESSTNIRDSQPKEQQTLASAVLQDSRNIINISEDITANTSSPTTEVAYASSTTDTSSATKSRVLSKKAKIYDMRRPTFHSEEEHYAFSREINKNQIISLKDAVKVWAKWLDTQVEAQNMSAAVFTINQHYLSHLHTTIERNGPLPYLAAFNMERAIGEIKRRIRSKINAGVNSGNVLVDLSAVRRRKRLERDDDNNDDDDENDEDEERPNHAVNVINKKSRMDVISISDDRDSPEIWGPFAEQSIQELHCKNQLRHFWAWHNESYTGINIDVDEVVETGTRLQMNKNTYGGSVRESFVRLHIDVDIDRRISKAKVNPAKRQYVGDIKYFFKHGCIVRGEYCEKLLAFVKIYKTVKKLLET